MLHHPDVIITDMRMPQGSGDYVIECLKRNQATRDIPIIVLTGRRDPVLQRYLCSLGVAQYLIKPVQFPVLCAELERHIALEPQIECEAVEPEDIQQVCHPKQPNPSTDTKAPTG
jgi:CheY-like chemotaxis protein